MSVTHARTACQGIVEEQGVRSGAAQARGTARPIRTAGIAALAMILTALWLPGCQIGVRGEVFTIGPRQKSAPTVGTKIGQVTIEGRTFCLYDAGTDGVPDFAYDPTTGRWYPIVASPPATPFMPSPEIIGQPQIVEYGPLQPHASNMDPGTTFQPGQWDWVADAIDLESGIEGTTPFDFGGLSAEDWIAATGLDVEPETMIQIEHTLDVVLVDTDDWYAEIQVPWSSAFHFPDLADYPVDYEVYGVPSDSDGPTFHVIRLAGDLVELIGFLVEMGGSELSFVYEGSTWTVVADENARIASLYEDGAFVMATPF